MLETKAVGRLRRCEASPQPPKPNFRIWSGRSLGVQGLGFMDFVNFVKLYFRVEGFRCKDLFLRS